VDRQAQGLEDALLDHLEPEVPESIRLERQVEGWDAELPVGAVVEARRQRVGDRVADHPEEGGHRRQGRQAEVLAQRPDRRLARRSGSVAGRAEDDRRAQPRRHQPRPGPGVAPGKGDDVAPLQLVQQHQRRQRLARLHRPGHQLVERRLGRRHAREAGLERIDVARRPVPRDQPQLPRHGGQQLRRQVARSLEVHPVVARRRLEQAPLAPLRRALEEAPLGPAAQRVQELAGEQPPQRLGIDVAEHVRPHLEPLDAVEPRRQLGRERRGQRGDQRRRRRPGRRRRHPLPRHRRRIDFGQEHDPPKASGRRSLAAARHRIE